MYHSKVLLKKNCSNNNLKQKNESNFFFKKKLISQSETKQNNKKLKLDLSDLYLGKPKEKIKNKTKFLFNDIIYHNFNEYEKSFLYRPIEKIATKLIKNKKESIYNITPFKKKQNIFYTKLKPTPFEKNLQKKKYLKNILLKKKSDINNRKLKEIRNHSFSLPNLDNKIKNLSFIFKNNIKLKKLYINKPQYFFNLSNIIHAENQIKIKNLDKIN